MTAECDGRVGEQWRGVRLVEEKAMDSFPLVQGGPPPTRLCHRCRPAQPTSVHTD